jgi:hypothetical protein
MRLVSSGAVVTARLSATTSFLAVAFVAAGVVVGRDAGGSPQTRTAAAVTVIRHPPELECDIWLARSTIPGAGLGMYAGRDFNASETLHRNHNKDPVGDLCVPLVDLSAHYGETLHLLMHEYVWQYVSNRVLFAIDLAPA